jgi:hypothetical protein
MDGQEPPPEDDPTRLASDDVQADQLVDDVSRARQLLPTVLHPAIECDLPVLQMERYKFDAFDLLFHTSTIFFLFSTFKWKGINSMHIFSTSND